jgi:hypothetical protein
MPYHPNSLPLKVQHVLMLHLDTKGGLTPD